jgi:transposase
MKKNIFIGIDVSKATLDICIKCDQSQSSIVINNNTKDIKKFFKQFTQQNAIVAMENTGRYNWALYEVLAGYEFIVYVIPPLHLKKSTGLVRGKNDKIDAIRITEFICKNHDTLTPWKQPALAIQKLKVLLTERSYRIKTKRQLLNMQHDYALMQSMQLDKQMLKMNKKLILEIEKQIKTLNDQMANIIQCNEQLSKQAQLMQSVPGVGKILCWTMLAKTNGFTSITTARKMACYSGVAPFDCQSGTSIKHKPHVSVLADKTLKKILHLAAMSAIRLKNDLSEYYLRKVSEGKNKMSVLNAVRNKIIHRIYAVIKNQTVYKNNIAMS